MLIQNEQRKINGAVSILLIDPTKHQIFQKLIKVLQI